MKFADISIGVPIYASDFGDFVIPMEKDVLKTVFLY